MSKFPVTLFLTSSRTALAPGKTKSNKLKYSFISIISIKHESSIEIEIIIEVDVIMLVISVLCMGAGAARVQRY